MGAIRHVVGAILVDEIHAPGGILAAQRSGPPPIAGRWEFPGGKVERDESPQNALKREIREELGVEIELGDELINPAEPEWPISDAMTMRVWLATVSAGEPRARGSHRELRWLHPADLLTVPWLDADRPIAEFLIASSILTDQRDEVSRGA